MKITLFFIYDLARADHPVFCHANFSPDVVTELAFIRVAKQERPAEARSCSVSFEVPKDHFDFVLSLKMQILEAENAFFMAFICEMAGKFFRLGMERAEKGLALTGDAKLQLSRRQMHLIDSFRTSIAGDVNFIWFFDTIMHQSLLTGAQEEAVNKANRFLTN